VLAVHKGEGKEGGGGEAKVDQTWAGDQAAVEVVAHRLIRHVPRCLVF
jgi:hypothetical protein